MNTSSVGFALLGLVAIACSSTSSPVTDGDAALTTSDGGVEAGAACSGSDLVTFELKVNGAGVYCDGKGCANDSTFVAIRPEAGGSELVVDGGCRVCESDCSAITCAEACMIPSVVPTEGSRTTWNGTIFVPSTVCGGTSCLAPSCAAPGNYIAKICAYAVPDADAGSSGLPVCSGELAATSSCVEVPFTWPTAPGTVISGTITP